MGIEKVRDEVLNKAKRQASQIISQGQKEAGAIAKATQQQFEELKASKLDKINFEISKLKTREISGGELEVSKRLLNSKKKIIDEVFNNATEMISNLPPAKRKDHIRKLVEKAKNSLDIGKLYCNEKDIKFVDGYKVQPINILGGVIAESKDSSIRIDLSYESLLEKIREEKLKDVAKILFND